MFLSKEKGKKGERQDKESDMKFEKRLVLSSRGRSSAYVYANLYFTLEMKEGEEHKKSAVVGEGRRAGGGGPLKQDKTNRSSAMHVVSSL